MPARIAVAMSGGVDSSAAAALLKEQGCDLVGFSMQLWDQNRAGAPGDVPLPSRCCSLDDIYDARSVASRLKIPYYVINLERQFEDLVVRSFIRDYCAGSTPSPCVLCNSHLKFDHLLRMAREVEAEHVATGHYARIMRDPGTGRYLLLRGRDAEKDQSYFLFDLKQDQLARAMFPLGDLTKVQVRELARRYGLSVADKPESQEICFVPDGDYAAFVERHYRDAVEDQPAVDPLAEGEIVDSNGRVLGRHRGIHRYTIGQRRGLGIAHSKPLYVIDLLPDRNRVVVGERSEAGVDSCRVVRPNWISIPAISGPIRAFARIRSRHREAAVTITPEDEGSLNVKFETPQVGVSPGQACVFYEGEGIIGGGWIARSKHAEIRSRS